MPAEQIADGVHWLRLGMVNAYLIRRQGRAVLIDTGLPRHGPIVRAILAELGVGIGSLRAILLTHRHLDHVGGAEMLRRHFQVPVFVHEAEARAVRGDERLSPARRSLAGAIIEPLVAISDRWVFGFQPCKQLETFAGQRREVIDGIVAVHLPGHTYGHCGYIDTESSVLFGGDAAVCSPDGELKAHSTIFTLDEKAARSSLRQIEALDVSARCFGHGRPNGLMSGA